MRRRALFYLSIFFILSAVGLLVWSLRPVPPSTLTIPVRSQDALAAGLPDQLTLSMPATLRLGQAGELVLSLPGRQAPGLPGTAQVEARLELPGVEIAPGWRLLQTVTPGTPITLRWQLSPVEPGKLDGMLWLTWTAVVNGVEQYLPVLARPLQLQVDSFQGQPVWLAQLLALVCGVAGVISFSLSRNNPG